MFLVCVVILFTNLAIFVSSVPLETLKTAVVTGDGNIKTEIKEYRHASQNRFFEERIVKQERTGGGGGSNGFTQQHFSAQQYVYHEPVREAAIAKPTKFNHNEGPDLRGFVNANSPDLNIFQTEVIPVVQRQTNSYASRETTFNNLPQPQRGPGSPVNLIPGFFENIAKERVNIGNADQNTFSLIQNSNPMAKFELLNKNRMSFIQNTQNGNREISRDNLNLKTSDNNRGTTKDDRENKTSAIVYKPIVGGRGAEGGRGVEGGSGGGGNQRLLQSEKESDVKTTQWDSIALDNKSKPETKLTTVNSANRSQVKEEVAGNDSVASNDGFKVFFGNEDTSRSETSDSNGAEPVSYDDGKIIFEFDRKRNSTGTRIQGNIMKIDPSKHEDALTTTTEVESVTLDNRNAFDVNVTCGPGTVKIMEKCIETA